MRRFARIGAWCGAAALVVLAARALAYALAPRPTALALELEGAAGGPRLVVVAACSLGLALGLSAAIVGLAALAVRERLALEHARIVAPPRLRPLRLGGRFAGLFVVTAGSFALLESYLHWRAGLGWHGLHCLIGPVHRDALPLLAGLSLVAAALFEAVEHLLAFARRVAARLAPAVAQLRQRTSRPAAPPPVAPALQWLAGALACRGPPDRLLRVL